MSVKPIRSRLMVSFGTQLVEATANFVAIVANPIYRCSGLIATKNVNGTGDALKRSGVRVIVRKVRRRKVQEAQVSRMVWVFPESPYGIVGL